jgi:hypothetical protein
VAKPTDLGEWSSLADYPADAAPEAGTPTVVVPTSGAKGSGWRPGQKPTAQVANWLGHIAYLWHQYLSDGALEGDHSIDGNLDVVGDLDVTGSGTFGIDVAARDYKFSAQRSRRIPACAALSTNDGSSWTYNHLLAQWDCAGTDDLHFPLPVEFGDRIEGVLLWVTKGTANTTTLSAELVQINDSTGVQSVIASSGSNANAPGIVGFTFPTAGPSLSLPHQVVGDCSYFIRVFSSTGGALDKVRGAEVNVTRPV